LPRNDKLQQDDLAKECANAQKRVELSFDFAGGGWAKKTFANRISLLTLKFEVHRNDSVTTN
jgi:hypothetical protein